MSNETLQETDRRMPVGAEPAPGGGAHFRVWAPSRRRVEVVLESGAGGAAGDPVPMERDAEGYFSVLIPSAAPGDLYRYRLDGGDEPRPDPASRSQPEGPHGPSRIVDPSSFRWTDDDWPGPTIHGQVVYEMHVGTFTPEGTWAAAERLLPYLAETGITMIELMPIADFPGEFGWGYDGVSLFAPTRLYGTPDELRRFVDAAHGLGIAVILDVVYNHLGPSGNYLGEFSPDYFTDRYVNEWGAPVNFDGPNSGPVREFFIANAAYWIDEFHMDGLRLDATQQMFDASVESVVAAMTRAVREAAGTRRTVVIAENEPQDVIFLRDQAEGGYGVDALWNDDFHHAAVVALTGQREAYYSAYTGSVQELVSAAKYGFLYQGQYHGRQTNRRGTSTRGFPRSAFVEYLENHDQIANSATCTRLHEQTSPGRYRALTALLLLGPGTPMLFQGQEFGSTRPFLYFADHEPELAAAVRSGRIEFLRQFRGIAEDAEFHRALADPADPDTFRRSKLDHAERERNLEARALHRDLIRLRRETPAFAGQGRDGIDGAVLTDSAMAVRFFRADGDDRLLVVNLGAAGTLDVASEPLLAPPAGTAWRTMWSTDRPAYGGRGETPTETANGWRIAAESAYVLAPGPTDDPEPEPRDDADG